MEQERLHWGGRAEDRKREEVCERKITQKHFFKVLWKITTTETS